MSVRTCIVKRKFMKLTSRDNERLKSARKVRDGKTDGMIFIEGVRLAEETMRSDIKISECFVSDEFEIDGRRRELHDDLIRMGISITEVSSNIFRSIADTANTQGIVLLAKRPSGSKEEIVQNLLNSQIVVFLHEVGDPSNLGGILRAAEAAGVAGVIVSNGSVDVFSPKAVRAAMGSSFRLPIWEKADFDEVLLWSIDQGLKTTAADISANKSYSQIEWKIPRLLIFGSEAHGLHMDTLERIEELVQIPMENDVESLNLAVSCGIILFEAKRQRECKPIL